MTQGAPPINELGIPDTQYGAVTTSQSMPGLTLPWSQFIDEHEFVPELTWPTSIQTYSQMRTDSQLAGLLTAVIYGISQLRFMIDDNGARNKIVKGVSEDLNLPIRGKDDTPHGRRKHRFSHQKHVKQAMLSQIYGHMYFEQVGEIVDGMWRLRKLAPRMPQSIVNINVAEDGGLVSITQHRSGIVDPTRMFVEIPVDRLVGYIFEQEGASWVGRPFLRDCYKDWLIKDRLVRVDAINHERAGGVPYVEAPPGATQGEIEKLSLMMQQFRIGDTAGGALPSGAELKLAKGTGSDVDKSIHSRDESMARRFLLQLMNLAQSGQHVGSYALGETFEDFFIVAQRAIAQWYCETTTEHLIEDWVDWNYGEDEELVPQITWDRTSEDALGVEQLATLVQRGIIVVDEELEDAIRYKYRLPKRSEPRPEVITPAGPTQMTEQQAQQPGAGTKPSAPSGRTPAPAPAKTAASYAMPFDWERDTMYSKPDVMASQGDPVMVVVPDVPILEAGVEYMLGTGPTTFTPEDLADVVTAANEDPSIKSPRLALGHIDPRFNDPKTYDANPSFGSAHNLRLSDNGMVVYADYSVPKWLAPILPVAFPNRSIEGMWGVQSVAGKRWRFVLSRCAMLGVQWPGITQLEDLPAYYGERMPADVVLSPELVDRLAVAANLKGGGEVNVKASANLDDVRRAFYGNYVPQSGKDWWWVRAVLVSPNQLVIEDDQDGQLYLMSFTSDAKGDVSFGNPEAVRLDYVPDQREEKQVANKQLAAALVTGREVLATFDTRASSRPTEERGGMDPKEIRRRLNLPEDATDEQVQAAFGELQTAVGTTEQPPTPPPAPAEGEEEEDGAGEGEEQPTPPTPTPPPEPEPAAAPESRQPVSATVTLDRVAFEQLKEGAAAGLSVKQEQEAERRSAAVKAAIDDGRVPPARRDHWLKALEVDYEGNSQVLASLAPGLVPVNERGTGAANEDGTAAGALSDTVVTGWTDSLFPETAQRRQEDAVAASVQHPQIQRGGD